MNNKAHRSIIKFIASMIKDCGANDEYLSLANTGNDNLLEHMKEIERLKSIMEVYDGSVVGFIGEISKYYRVNFSFIGIDEGNASIKVGRETVSFEFSIDENVVFKIISIKYRLTMTETYLIKDGFADMIKREFTLNDN